MLAPTAPAPILLALMSFPEPFYSWRPHPWHGISPGPKPPEIVQAYVEITPFDLVK